MNMDRSDVHVPRLEGAEETRDLLDGSDEGDVGGSSVGRRRVGN